MKIEKVNDHQIRCTLTKADLADRELKISELAYGTEKAKNLFRDMMQQASQKFGFEAEDIPLMIEAIPLSSDCIVLIITKVEDPEELDTRFSKFAPSMDDDDEFDPEEIAGDSQDSTDSIFDLFRQIQESRRASLDSASKGGAASDSADTAAAKTEAFLNEEKARRYPGILLCLPAHAAAPFPCGSGLLQRRQHPLQERFHRRLFPAF